MKPILKTIHIFMTIKDILITVMDEILINYELYENNVP